MRTFAIRAAFGLSFLGTAIGPVSAVDPETANKQVIGLYKQILEREPDASEPAGYAKRVADGTPLRHVVREMVTSDEYQDRFVKTNSPKDLVPLLYKHIHRREPESAEVTEFFVKQITTRGWRIVAFEMADGKEARINYGNDPTAPRVRGSDK